MLKGLLNCPEGFWAISDDSKIADDVCDFLGFLISQTVSGVLEVMAIGQTVSDLFGGEVIMGQTLSGQFAGCIP